MRATRGQSKRQSEGGKKKEKQTLVSTSSNPNRPSSSGKGGKGRNFLYQPGQEMSVCEKRANRVNTPYELEWGAANKEKKTTLGERMG